MSNDSYVVQDAGKARAFVGPDAVELASVRMLRSSLVLWKKTKLIPTRGWTITRMLAACHKYTGKKYTRNQIDEAVVGLDNWLATMSVALPVVDSSGKQVS